jgi:transposase
MQGLLNELQAWETRDEIDLYYFDETGVSQRSELPYAWSPVGESIRMPAYSHSKRLNVLGFLSRQGRLIYHTTTGKVTTEVVLEAFDRLIAAKPKDKFAVVILDNARIHHAKKFQQKRREWRDHGVYVLFLPTYSPELNLIELLWRKVKYEWLPLEAYRSFDRLCEHVQKVLSGYGQEYRNIYV